MTSLTFFITLALCLVLAFLGVKLGMRSFVFTLVSLGCLFLMVLLSVKFTRPLAGLLEPWIATVITIPCIIIFLCGTILLLGLKLLNRIEETLANLTDGGNRALGGVLGLALAIILGQLIL